MLTFGRSSVGRYVVAVVAVFTAAGLMLLLNAWVSMQGSPFLLFFAAVMLGAWYGGFGPGILATALATVLSTFLFIEPTGSLLIVNSGNVIRLGLFVLVSLLITTLSAARRSLIRALRKERDLIAAIVSTAGSLIVVLDRRGRIVQFNRACEQMTGYTLAEIKGRHIWELLIPADQSEVVKQVFQDLCRGHFPNEHENDWLTKDGNRRLIAWSNTVLLDDHGLVAYIIGTGLDITERQQSQQRLQEMNQTLEALIQSSPVAITVLNQQGIVELWNPAAERIFGWSVADAIGRFMPTVPADKQAEFQENIALTLRGDRLNGVETRRQRRDGSFIEVGLWTAVVRGATAAEDSVMSIVVDLSERKQAEAALKLSQERLTSFVEANVIGIVFCSISGEISEANDEYLRIIGYSRQELYDGTIRWVDITPAEYLPIDEAHLAVARDTGESVPYEKEYVHKDGHRVPILVGFSLLSTDRQQAVAFVLDLTERKRLEQTLRQQTEELAQVNRMKDEFLAVLSHELRTPLNAILGWSRLLQTRQFDAATTARALDTIERNAYLQTQLIGDILDVSRIIQGKLRLQLRPVALVPIVTAAIEAMHPTAAAKSIRLETDLNASVGMVLGDPDRLQQIIWNLLSNAIKFTPAGGSVAVRLAPSTDQQSLTDQCPALPLAQPLSVPSAQISIRDTGKGISAEFLPFVFDRFRQADSSSTRSEGGLGLGLAIVRHLVELHGGTVQAMSPGLNQGATFVVTFPLLRETLNGMAAAPAAQWSPVESLPLVPSTSSYASTSSLADAVTAMPTVPDLKGLQILVVDDERDTREFLRTVLENYGAIVMAAASVAEALQLLTPPATNGDRKPWQPDILISDIGMPQEDGYSLIHTVRTQLAVGEETLPAIALTAYATEDDRRRTLERGFQMHLTKPIDPVILAQSVSHLSSGMPPTNAARPV